MTSAEATRWPVTRSPAWSPVRPKRRSRAAKDSARRPARRVELAATTPSAEVQLGVGQVPQQEIADPLLAAGADQEVRIRQAVQLQGAPRIGFVDVAGLQSAAGAACGELARRMDDVPAPAVTQRLSAASVRRFAAVAASAAAIRACRMVESRSRSPMNRRRTPLRCNSGNFTVEGFHEQVHQVHRLPSSGRRQFSLLNANSVSASTPRRAHSSMHRRTESMPARWPACRGNPRWLAQRPLPSMMIAI